MNPVSATLSCSKPSTSKNVPSVLGRKRKPLGTRHDDESDPESRDDVRLKSSRADPGVLGQKSDSGREKKNKRCTTRVREGD